MSKNDGGPAFPRPSAVVSDEQKEMIRHLRKARVCKDGVRRYPHKHERNAADLIEAQAAEIVRLLAAIAGPAAWLDSWAQHVGNCQGGYVCTCGLVRARSELSAALAQETQP